ncbi:MAG: response regulator [Pseudomonadota bacterium]
MAIILIVDDVLENVRLLKNLLQDFGQIVFARNGKEALEQAERHRPDIVLLDVMMPEMDGYETCRRLKALPASLDTPVIFITAASAESDEALGLEVGAIDYITKPFAPAIVRARVQNHLALVRAVAEHKRMENELRDSNERIAAQAAQLEQQNGYLLENARLREEVERISRHDLKTPLGSIIAVPRLLREQKRLSPEDDELLTIVERAGYRILSMVNLSLDLYKMEQGSYTFTPRALDLVDVVNKVAADLRSHAASRNVSFSIQVRRAHDPDADAPQVYVLAEELLCYSAAANLLKNALEASPDGRAVTVSIDGARNMGDAVLMRIHNHGTVPEAVRARFFDKYASAGKSGGSGLGTYSAQLMTRAQNGDIEMHTGVAGTTLTVRLPSAPKGIAGGNEPVDARDSNVDADLPALRVLVVDDDEVNLLVMRRFLPSPLQVETAMNGRAGIDTALAHRPDVIFMDLEMPVMNGMDATRRLRELEQGAGGTRCVIIGLSSHDDQETRRESLAAGCDFYLVKPVTKEQIRRTLHDVANSALAKPPPQVVVEHNAQSAHRFEDVVCVDQDLRDALPAFLQSRREALDRMTLLCAMDDVLELRQLAHRLAGSFALYGFRWAGSHCQFIEREVGRMERAALQEQLALLGAHLTRVTIRFVDMAAGS